MPDTHHRTICVAFGAGIPQDTFVSKLSLFYFLCTLCTNNLVKKLLWFFFQTLKPEEKNSRTTYACWHRVDFKHTFLCLFLC